MVSIHRPDVHNSYDSLGWLNTGTNYQESRCDSMLIVSLKDRNNTVEIFSLSGLVASTGRKSCPAQQQVVQCLSDQSSEL